MNKLNFNKTEKKYIFAITNGFFEWQAEYIIH
jgi:hypothetical protein